CLLDGYAYATRTYHRHRILNRLKRPRTWMKTLQRVSITLASELQRRVRGPAAEADGARAPGKAPRLAIFEQPWPRIGEVRAGIDRMLTRGVRMLFVYTGGWSGFVGERQFDEMFPRLAGRNQVTLRYYEHADHTFLALEDREVLFGDVCDFVKTV